MRTVLAGRGDETVRTAVYDIAPAREWPAGYTGQLMINEFIRRWHGQEDALKQSQSAEKAAVEQAYASGDYEYANVTVGQAARRRARQDIAASAFKPGRPPGMPASRGRPSA